jgi:N-acetylglucosaminyl-diphospho-decaprenol L-rhamnosyltransferase
MQCGVPQVAAIVVSWNTRALLAQCLASIAAAGADADIETVVVDNASADGSAAMVRDHFPWASVIANADNRGFAAANNQGLAATSAPYVLMLNSDARLEPGALPQLVARLESTPAAGLVGAQLRNFDGSFQHSHARFPTLGREALILSGLGRVLYGRWYPSVGPVAGASARPVEWVGGACMLARRTALDAVGGFDEGYALYGEEMDLCYALRQRGHQIWYEPAAVVLHRRGASTAQLAEGRELRLYHSRMRFVRKHYGARAARLFALELVVFTAPKIALHRTLRTVTGDRVGRRTLSLRALRAVVGGADHAAGPLPAADQPATLAAETRRS